MPSEREKERYSRDPIATTHQVDWWRVGRTRFLRRMRPADRHEWERFARVVSVAAKEQIVFPASLEPTYAVVVSGRVRLAIPEPDEEQIEAAERRPDAPSPEAPPGPAPRTTGVTWTPPVPPPRPKPSSAPPPPPKHPIVYVAEVGDLIGTFATRGAETVARPLEVEALRDTVIQFASASAFRGYLWRRPGWRMPAPAADCAPCVGVRRQGVRALARVVDAIRSHLGPASVGLADLCGRTRNSRAACAVLGFLGEGHTLAGPELRIRRRLWPGQLACRIGADPQWVKMWIDYAESEGLVGYARGRWTIKQQWRLHGWAERSSMEQSFALPPDPFDEPLAPEETLGRASRNADGTTPVTDVGGPGAGATPY